MAKKSKYFRDKYGRYIPNELKNKLKSSKNQIIYFNVLDCASFAVRQRSLDYIINGLHYIFYESNNMEDYRDVICNMAVIYDALQRMGEDPSVIMAKYGDDNQKINPEIKKYIDEFLERDDLDIGVYSISGYIPVEEPEFHYEWPG